jgi:mRNA interferase MazF
VSTPPTITRGELYWVAPDDRTPISHPWVVVQDDLFNHSRVTTIIACALSTNLHKATEPGNVLLDDGEGDLPKQSVVIVSQIESIHRERFGARIGALTQERVEQILDGLRFQQRAFFDR